MKTMTTLSLATAMLLSSAMMVGGQAQAATTNAAPEAGATTPAPSEKSEHAANQEPGHKKHKGSRHGRAAHKEKMKEHADLEKRHHEGQELHHPHNAPHPHHQK